LNLFGSFSVVGLLILCSRILGFFRDIMIARLLGTGVEAEAFFTAFRLPNLFRRLFAEGAFNAAFVPLFSKKYQSESLDEALNFAEEIYSWLLVLLIVFFVISQLLMPFLVMGLAYGFHDDPERMSLTVLYSRITFAYLIFMSLLALMSGILNTLNYFIITSAVSLCLNIVLVAGIYTAYIKGWSVGLTMAWGVFFSGILQYFMVWYSLKAENIRLKLRRPRLTQNVKDILKIGFPGFITGSVMQLNLLVSTQIASGFKGSIAWIHFADRLYQLPLGIIGAAVAIVLLPKLSGFVKSDDMDNLCLYMKKSSIFCIFFALPLSVAMCVIPYPIVSLLFEGNSFTKADVRNTADILQIFSIGVVPYIFVKLLNTVYFAYENTKKPMYYGIGTVIINVVLSYMLMDTLGFLAVPMGSVVAVWCNLIMLWVGLLRYEMKIASSIFHIYFVYFTIASTVMAIIMVWMCNNYYDAFAVGAEKYLIPICIMGVGAFLYFVINILCAGLWRREARVNLVSFLRSM